jgi:hypothetical protein
MKPRRLSYRACRYRLTVDGQAVVSAFCMPGETSMTSGFCGYIDKDVIDMYEIWTS